VISDTEALAEIRAAWEGVNALRAKIDRGILGAFASGGWQAPMIADIPHNLPFIHACAVLNEALLQLRDEGRFTCRRFFLGALVQASRDSLPWKNHSLITRAVERRNDLAHRGEVLPRGECSDYVAAIGSELTAWRVV
jgi:hypothetical protein